MSTHLKPQIEAFRASGDLSTHQFKMVKLSDKETVALSGNGERAIGILMNAPKDGEIAEVAVAGGAKVKIASTLSTIGASIASGANGIGEAPSAAEWCLGIITDTGVSGDIIPMIIDRHHAPA